jgi:hypothetical protein
MNEFDEAIFALAGGNDWTLATVAIADTAYLARLWFRSYGVEFTAADLLRFVELVQKGRGRGQRCEETEAHPRFSFVSVDPVTGNETWRRV